MYPRTIVAVLVVGGFGFAARASTPDFTTINLPGDPRGINNAGQIVGFSISNFSGFLQNPDGTATTIQVKSTGQTLVYSINNSGQIVGQYDDAGFHGFLDNAGSFTMIDLPSAVGLSYAAGINDAGEIVGNHLSGPVRILSL
jgi:hypothetical protein